MSCIRLSYEVQGFTNVLTKKNYIGNLRFYKHIFKSSLVAWCAQRLGGWEVILDWNILSSR